MSKICKLKALFNSFGYFRSNKKGFFKKMGSRVDDVIYVLLSFVGTLVLSVSCAFLSSKKIYWLGVLIGGFFLVIGLIGTHLDMRRAQKTTSELSKDLEQEKNRAKKSAEESERTGIKLQDTDVKLRNTHEEFVVSILKIIAKESGLDTNTRVSIYFEEEGQFLILGRYSQNPKFKEIHTRYFSKNKGALSKAWEHGTYFDSDCCSYQNSESEYKEYQNKKFDYTEIQINKLTMKSCEYIGIALKHVEENIGVILFESEGKGFVSQKRETIIAQVKSHHDQLSARIADGKVIYRERMSTIKKDVDDEFISEIKSRELS